MVGKLMFKEFSRCLGVSRPRAGLSAPPIAIAHPSLSFVRIRVRSCSFFNLAKVFHQDSDPWSLAMLPYGG